MNKKTYVQIFKYEKGTNNAYHWRIDTYNSKKEAASEVRANGLVSCAILTVEELKEIRQQLEGVYFDSHAGFLAGQPLCKKFGVKSYKNDNAQRLVSLFTDCIFYDEAILSLIEEPAAEVAAEELEQLVEQAGNSVLNMEAEALEIYKNIKANSSDDTYWAAWEMVNTFSTKCFNVWHDSDNIINDEKLIRKEFEALKDELLGFLKPSSATIKEVAAEAAEAAAEALEASLTAEAEAVAANHSEEAEAAAEAAATVAALTEEHQERAEKCNFMYNRIKDYVIRLERAMDKYSVTREMYQEAKELYAEVRLTLLDAEAAIDSFIAAAESTDLYYSKKAFLELQAAYDIFVICYIDRIKKTIRAMRHFNNMSTAKASEVAETTEAAAEAAATAEALETQEETEAAAVADLVATDKYCNYILVTFNDGSQHIRSVPKPGSSRKACVFGNVRYFKQRYAANPQKFKLSPLGFDVINS